MSSKQLDSPGQRVIPYKRTSTELRGLPPAYPAAATPLTGAVVQSGAELTLGVYILVPATAAGIFTDWGSTYGSEAFTDTNPGLTVFKQFNFPFSSGEAYVLDEATLYWGRPFRGPDSSLTPITFTGGSSLNAGLYLSNGDTDLFGAQVFRVAVDAVSDATPLVGDSKSVDFQPWNGASAARRGERVMNPLGGTMGGTKQTRIQLTMQPIGGSIVAGYVFLEIVMREVGGG